MPIILLSDEASWLTSVGSEAEKEVTDEFISMLWSLKDPHQYTLYSLAFVSTETEKTLLAGWFTKAEVKELFDQFAMDMGTRFESANISADIFELTLGHKGLIGACGSYIQQTYEYQNSPIITADDWKKTTIIGLQKYICEMPHYNLIMQSLGSLSPECTSILNKVLCYGTKEVEL
ncbi:348_t:CDS:2, partial [Paraglomus brasilianum]